MVIRPWHPHVFAAPDDIGPASLAGSCRAMLPTYRMVHLAKAGLFAEAGSSCYHTFGGRT
jgi:hypothetical protein